MSFHELPRLQNPNIAAVSEYLEDKEKRSKGEWTWGPHCRLISVTNNDGSSQIKCANGCLDRIKAYFEIGGYSFDLGKIKTTARTLGIDQSTEFKTFESIADAAQQAKPKKPSHPTTSISPSSTTQKPEEMSRQQKIDALELKIFLLKDEKQALLKPSMNLPNFNPQARIKQIDEQLEQLTTQLANLK